MSDNPFEPDNSNHQVKANSREYMEENFKKSTQNLHGITFLAVVAIGVLAKLVIDKLAKKPENESSNKTSLDKDRSVDKNSESIGNKLSNQIRNMFGKDREVSNEKDSAPEFVQGGKENQTVWQNAQQLQNFRQKHQKGNVQNDREQQGEASVDSLDLSKTNENGSNSIGKTLVPEAVIPEDQSKAAVTPGAIAPGAKNQKEGQQDNQGNQEESGLNSITRTLDALIKNNKGNKDVVAQAKKLKSTIKESEQNTKPQKDNKFNANQAGANMIKLFKQESKDDKSLTTESYDITRRGKEYTMSDKLGNTLLVAKDNGSFGTGIQENNLTPDTKKDLKYLGEDLDQKKPSTGGFERAVKKKVFTEGAKAAGTAYGGPLGGFVAEKVADKVGDKLQGKVEGKTGNKNPEKKVNRFEKELQTLNANTTGQTGKTKSSNYEID
ncbi:MAG: hypothetical protein RLZZ574_2171 [Cyanobacteriota bacterium]|jgi:hypothetical protein